MNADNGEYDRRRPPAPHCYRVVQLGVSISSDMARALTDRTCGTVPRNEERVRGSTLFEPKVGGGGHLLLLEEDHGTPWARVLVEPDGPTMTLVAAILYGDWEASDEVLAARVRDWLTALHGPLAAAFDSPPSAASSAESLNAGGDR